MVRLVNLLPSEPARAAFTFYGSALVAAIAALWTLYVHFFAEPSVILVSKDATIDCEDVHPGPSIDVDSTFEGGFTPESFGLGKGEVTGRILRREKSLISSDEARVRLSLLYIMCRLLAGSDLPHEEKISRFVEYTDALYGKPTSHSKD